VVGSAVGSALNSLRAGVRAGPAKTSSLFHNVAAAARGLSKKIVPAGGVGGAGEGGGKTFETLKSVGESSSGTGGNGGVGGGDVGGGRRGGLEDGDEVGMGIFEAVYRQVLGSN